jgi:hypothetical protein
MFTRKHQIRPTPCDRIRRAAIPAKALALAGVLAVTRPPVAAVIAALLLLIPSTSAQAAWSSFTKLGDTTFATSEASCAAASTGKVACAVTGANHQLAVNIFTSKWSGWTVLPGIVSSNPSCTDRAAGEIICAVRGTDNKLLYTVYNGTSWSALAVAGAGGSLFSAPSCARVSASRAICVARSAAGGITSSVWNGTAWSTFTNIAGAVTAGPSCATDQGGKVICAVVTSNGHVLVNRNGGTSSWEGFLDIGGSANTDPTCVKLGLPGQVLCLVRNAGYLYSSRFIGGAWVPAGWGSWTYAGAYNFSKASCGLQTVGVVVCAVVDQYNGTLWYGLFNGTWSTWTNLLATVFGPPACASAGSSRVLCAIVGLNNHLTSAVGP